MNARRSRARGLTLIETLVTILIMSVLVGILLPTLSRARSATRDVACKASLRSLGQAVAMYREEYRDIFPYADTVATLESQAREPYAALASYLNVELPTRLATGEINTRPPYWCHADRAYAPTTGFSYIYRPWDLFLSFPASRTQAPVSKFLARAPEEVLFEDSAPRHGAAGSIVQRVHADGTITGHALTASATLRW